jgi:PAS domain S-box-containing protein
MTDSSHLHQALLEAILQSIPHGLVLFEPSGQMLFANNFAEQLFGFQPGECSKHEISSLFLEDDYDIFLPNIVKLTLDKGSFEGEALLRDRKERKFFAYLTTFVYRGSDKDVIVLTIQDIGTLKTLQRESIETERVRSMAKVVDQMAHHIRNPIAAIGGFAARLLKKGLDEKDRQLYKQIIYQEASRLDNLLKSLAGFTTLPLPAMTENDFDNLLKLSKDMVPDGLLAAASEWHAPSSEQLRSFHAFMDLEILARCLANVFINALESGDPSVVINFFVAEKGDRIQFSVSDNGRGIEPENLHRVFDPLFTTKNEHVGLGLTISQRIINDHGGSIEIESEVGKGTTVTLEIPREKRRPIRVRRL